MVDVRQEIKAMIAIPTMACKIEYRLCGWLYRILEYKGVKPTLVFKQAMPIDSNRNMIVQDFLKTDNEWLVFIDDDMIPKFEFHKIFEKIGDRKIVSAVCIAMQNGIPGPIIMKRSKEKDTSFRHITTDELKSEVVDGSYVEVDGVGTGFLVIHRSVFEKMPAPWFKFQYKDDGTMGLSEDYYFGQKAKGLGFKLWVNCDLPTGHTKYVDLYELNKILYKVVSAKKVTASGIGSHADKKEVFENVVK